MKHVYIILFFLLLYVDVSAYSIKENMCADSSSTIKRIMNYYPEKEDFVCINGNNRYTRALYGQSTQFRLETSDMPVFALYNKSNNRNVCFKIIKGNKSIRLDSLSYCKSYYGNGNRRYELRDNILGKGTVYITTIALPDKDGAMWKFESKNVKGDIKIEYRITEIRKRKLFRNGDLGVDPPDAFDSPIVPQEVVSDSFIVTSKKPECLAVVINEKAVKCFCNGEKIDGKPLTEFYFAEKCEKSKSLSGRIRFTTPDSFINPIGSAISMAADGIWDGQVWLHGAIGWRIPLNGWRAAYAGNFLGWHDRAKVHFSSYAASQVDDVLPIISHPSQDSTLNLARAEKKWGTQMYSNGYICRNPNNNKQMHHYDMNLCYMDELMWYFNWTGDLDFARKMWPVIVRHLAWEKRNFDPDNDGLYDAYCCIWASDALYYNSGAVTHSSAYNYRANLMASKIASKIGVDGTMYKEEAEKILKAMKSNLWIEKEGHWAEFKDFMGYKRIHDAAALWTIYHAIDSDVCTLEQAYRCTQYIDHEIPHIPICADGIDKDLYVMSTTNWLPFSWSINNVAFAESYHTALAYWQAGRNEEAFRILKGAVVDGMYLGKSPGNFGQISFYDVARGECYRDFGDAIGIASRALIQGLYGVIPDLMDNKVVLKPGFPNYWNEASLESPDICYSFIRKGKTESYNINHSFVKDADIILKIRKLYPNVDEVRVNGKKSDYDIEHGAEYDVVVVKIPKTLKNAKVIVKFNGNKLEARKINYNVNVKNVQRNIPGFENVTAHACEPIEISHLLNDSVSNIFTNEYLSPRSPYTTLQIPKQGVGEWCHPMMNFVIDDSGLRNKSVNNVFTAKSVPFISMKHGKNVAFTSLWNNYPDSISISLTGKASNIYLLMAGTTNHMQSRIDNGIIIARYADGTCDTLKLRNPDNWCPIEQDYYIDENAFKIEGKRPYRVILKSGIVSDDIQKIMNIEGVYGRKIDGGAGVLVDFEVNAQKHLESLCLKTLSNEVIIGIIGVTLQRE